MIGTIGTIANVGCIMITFVIGGALLAFGFAEKESQGIVLGLILIVIGFATVVGSHFNNTQYISAEPIAYNQTQTVFTTDKGTYIADGLYPDGTYLLTIDGKDVLVVWQAVDGEVG